MDSGKLVELEGGPADGRRIAVPTGATLVSIPATNGRGESIMADYEPAKTRCADGVEIWRYHRTASLWTDSAPTPLT